MAFHEYARRPRNTCVLRAFEIWVCDIGASWWLDFFEVAENTHGAQGIRVYYPDPDFEMCRFGAPEIQKSSAGRLKQGF